MQLRSLAVCVLVLTTGTSVFANDDAARSSKPAATKAARPTKPEPARSAAKAAEAAPPAAPETALDLTPKAALPGRARENAGTSATPRVDLFNTDVLDRVVTGRTRSAGHNERSPGVRFGNDTWKSHVKQIGGMVAGFAALSALCAGSRCLLPKGLTSWMPGTTTEAPPAPARVGPQVKGMPKLR